MPNDYIDSFKDPSGTVWDIKDPSKQPLLAKGSISSVDLNTITTPGTYWVTNTEITNAPAGESATYGILEVISGGVGAHQQIYYLFDSSYGNRSIYTREYINSQWYQWVKLGLAKDMSTTSISRGINIGGINSSSIDEYGEVHRSFQIKTDFTDSYTAKTSLSNVTVPTDIVTTLHSFILDAGLYHIEAGVYFPQNSTGVRRIDITSKENTTETAGASYYLASQTLPTCSWTMCLHLSLYVKISATTTYYLRATQNSGSSLSVTPRLQILKLND